MTRIIRKLVAAGMVVILATTACAPLAVHPPYNEAEKGWAIERGRMVRIVTRDGVEVRGRIEAVDEVGFVVGGIRVERGDIDEMWMERESVVRPIVFTLALMGTIWAVIWAVWGSHTTPAPVNRPKPPDQ